jgi:hypothetical protein
MEKKKMCRLSDKIIKEAEEHRLCERLDEIHREYHNWSGSRTPANLVDLFRRGMYGMKEEQGFSVYPKIEK